VPSSHSRRWPRSSSPSAHRRAGATDPTQLVLLGFLAVGLAGGLLSGGRLTALGEVQLRWWALAVGGLLVQIVLFSAPVAAIVGQAGALLYVGSTVLVLAVLVRNLDQPWLRVVALGAGLNLLVIAVNGGVMPVDPSAFVAAGLSSAPAGTFSNTASISAAPLWFLGDVFATPAWVPFANVLSVGDLLIGVGAAGWIAAAMQRERPPIFVRSVARP
jgi:hypothetical protein